MHVGISECVHLNGVFLQEIVWAFHRNKKSGPNNEVTERRGFPVHEIMVMAIPETTSLRMGHSKTKSDRPYISGGQPLTRSVSEYFFKEADKILNPSDANFKASYKKNTRVRNLSLHRRVRIFLECPIDICKRNLKLNYCFFFRFLHVFRSSGSSK